MSNQSDADDNFPVGLNIYENNLQATLKDNEDALTGIDYTKTDFIGVPITEKKGKSVFRVYGGNPNGLTFGAGGGEFKEYFEEMKRMSVDAICLYEINLDTGKHKIKKAIYDNLQRLYDHHRVTYGSTAIPSDSEFKPGGTMLVTTDGTTGRVLKTGSDYMGRWSYQILSCKDARNLTIISAYQLCAQEPVTNDKVKTLTVTAQQTSVLRQQGVTTSPRKMFIKDLTTFITEQQQLGNGILLLGDFNELMDVSYTGMTKLCSDLNLTDLMFHEIGDDDFKTYDKSIAPRRIDYVLCSDWVADSVVAACYEPFKFRTKGDHRNIVIDFNAKRLFGNPTYKLLTPAQREFTSSDKTANRTYMEAKMEYLQDHNFADRLQQLQEAWDPGLAESLDRDFQRAGKVAAKKCKKKPNVVYIRKLADLRIKKNILLRVISQELTGNDLSAAIGHHARNGTNFVIPDNLEECKRECRNAQKEIRKLERDAETHRRNDLKTRHKELVKEGKKKEAKELRNLIVSENTKNMYRKLRFYRGTAKTGLNKLEVPADPTNREYKQCKEWITVDVPKEIEQKLMDRNQYHFGQADGSFPTVPPFSEWVDWGASTHVSELILEGDFEDATLDELTNDLVQHMKARTQLDMVDAEISIDEWKGKIKSWPESTSTSPSGFHLGHSKALVGKHDLDVNSPLGQNLENIRNTLIGYQVSLLNNAIRNGYSYDRWKTVVNVMILKEENNVRIHRLRVIHLYEHDYNLILALKWRKLIVHATLHQHLNSGQFGAVPGRDAIAPTIIEELQYEISRASKRPLVHMDYDATACYDRIIMSMGSLCSRSYGQHRQITLVNATTLQEAKYVLKTQLGVSESFYSHSDIHPIYGSGQGAGNSPGLWCVVSSTLFDLYEKKAHGATFHSPDGKESVSIYMIGFVDDTSGSINDFTNPIQQPVSHYVNLATDDAQRWNDVLKLTGGALEDTKCSYHLLYYDFSITGLPVMRGGKFEPTICIKFNDSSNATPLRHLSSHTTHKTLGVQKAPAGTTKASVRAISAKNSKHAKTISRSPFDRVDAWSYYHAIYLPSVTYPFPSGVLSDDECEKWQIEIKKAVLPKYGFNRSTPNAVVYGHSDYAGIEMRTLWVEKGILSLQHFLMCLRCEGVQQKLANIAISWAQYLAGTSVCILEDTITSLPHLDPMKWIPDIRKFLGKIGGKIELSKSYVVPLQREDDIHLMSVAIDMKMKPLDLQMLNACRLYLGVTMLSCITTADGRRIRNTAMIGEQSVLDQYRGHKAYQDRPSQTAWKVWQRLLRKFTDGTTDKLTQKLGRWYKTGEATYRKWRCYKVPGSTIFYLRKDDGFEEYEIQHDLAWEFNGRSVKVLPDKSIPIDVDFGQAQIVVLNDQEAMPQLVPSPPATFHDFVQTLEKWEVELLENVQFTTDVYDFVDRLHKNSKIVCTSDGSAPEFQGSFGWVCSVNTGYRIARNKGPAYGYRTSSYRAEGYGCLSFLRLIFRACEFTAQPLPQSLHYFTDSESLIKEVEKQLGYPFYYPSATLLPEWDLLQSIVATLRRFIVRPRIRHVVGHQDRQRAVESLPLEAQLNVEADKLAGEYEYSEWSDPATVPLIEGSSAQLHMENGTITSRLKIHIRKQSSKSAMKKFLLHNNGWSENEFDAIDWIAHGTAVRKHYSKKHFITKLVHNWLPLGNLVSRYNGYHSSKCHSCACEVEDRDHFLQCPSRIGWKDLLLTDIRKFCEENHTRPALLDILSDVIRSWLPGNEVVLSGYPDIYNLLITEQKALGWREIFMGRFTKEWSSLQQEYLSTIPGRKKKFSGKSWVQGIITVIWRHVHMNWRERNEIKHGKDAATREIELLERARRETAELYQVRDSVLPVDRDKFYTNIEEHYEKEPTSRGLRQWLHTWKPVLLQSVQESATRNLAFTRDIRTYFDRNRQHKSSSRSSDS